jgi:hypothetical protein
LVLPVVRIRSTVRGSMRECISNPPGYGIKGTPDLIPWGLF